MTHRLTRFTGVKIQSTVTNLKTAVAAEIVGVSEPEFHAFLSEKYPPNGKRGTIAACTIQPLVGV